MDTESAPGEASWLTAVEAAEIVADAESVQWDDEAELVIVGYGGAGVATALEAAENGVDVLAVDRYDGGGSTAMNGGIYYAGGGTVIQKRGGFSDTPEEMFKYRQGRDAVAFLPGQRRQRRLADGARRQVRQQDLLEEMGLS
jgi:3-oxo-5alpha-steroid 4-dehydrogenase